MLYVHGIGEGKITQAEMTDDDLQEHYPDYKDISDWAKESFRFFVKQQVISGKPGSGDVLFLDPQGELTRAEAAQIMNNYDQLLQAE